MKRSACLLLIIGGCALPAAPTDPPAQSPRERCQAVGAPDDYVDSQYLLFRAAFNDGYGQLATLVAADQVCQEACQESDNESCRSDCYACNAAIIDDVFTAAP